ncbi:MAG: GNAT family N-acetyltransferase [Lewinellaceae bacterium]|nr:GNAT family N-acetyltransferase [Lewinellaceae bacterium]
MSLEFRLAGPEDIEQILDMMEDFYAIDLYPFNREETRINVEKFIADPGLGRLWLVSTPEAVAGYAVLTFGYSFEFKGRDAFVDELYVVPEQRSKGLGAVILDYVLDQARAAGIKAVHLEVEKHNEKANRLYRSRQFEAHKRALMTKWL